MKTELVIFDMDGVLINSEKLYKEVNYKLFESLGVEINGEEYNGFIGIASSKMWSYIKEKGMLPHSVPALQQLEKDAKREALEKQPVGLIEGVSLLLAALKQKGITMCVASSSPLHNIEFILKKEGIREYFSSVTSGEEVKSGKPAPDIFLLAAQKKAVPPENCVVIEDSSNGINAANAAGMKAVGFISPHSGNQDLSLADFTASSFDNAFLESLYNLF